MRPSLSARLRFRSNLELHSSSRRFHAAHALRRSPSWQRCPGRCERLRLLAGFSAAGIFAGPRILGHLLGLGAWSCTETPHLRLRRRAALRGQAVRGAGCRRSRCYQFELVCHRETRSRSERVSPTASPRRRGARGTSVVASSWGDSPPPPSPGTLRDPSRGILPLPSSLLVITVVRRSVVDRFVS